MRLTDSEEAILILLGSGLTQRQVAQRMGLSASTINEYTLRARRRNGATTTELAVKLAVKNAVKNNQAS